MNVLLINPDMGLCLLPKTVPMGLLSIASYLQTHHHSVQIYDRNVNRTSLKKIVEQFSPQVVGVSVTTSYHIDDAMAISRYFREHNIPVVWGGHMATIIPELILQQRAADYVVLHEGEITFHELLQALENNTSVAQIDGLTYLDNNGNFVQTPDRAFACLAEFPMLDWSLVRPEKYLDTFMGHRNVFRLYTSKGCPGRCTFCVNESFNRRSYRARPFLHTSSDIDHLIEHHGVDTIVFYDELFGMDKQALRELCDFLRSRNIIWGAQTKIGVLSPDDMQHMYDCGCRWLTYGIETGSAEMQKRIRKGISLDKIDKDLQVCANIGIAAAGNFIIGFPDETKDQLRETVALILRSNFYRSMANIFSPIPGTKLYGELVETGRILACETLEEWSKTAIISFYGTTSNFSAVPTRHLLVLQNYIHWRSLFSQNKKLAQGMLKSTLGSLTQRRLWGMIRLGISFIKLFFSVAWYRFAYPDIRREYGLK
ncbi:MAG: B12-binding domain-containing radical SAM protein [Oscillospiraceae bacterium]|nr:B12-binding domain-containing radical SAM protein [Oscillospiraceae bacterium]